MSGHGKLGRLAEATRRDVAPHRRRLASNRAGVDRHKVVTHKVVMARVVMARVVMAKVVVHREAVRREAVRSSNVRINRVDLRAGTDQAVDRPKEVGRRDLRRRMSPNPRSPSRLLQLPRG